MPKLPALKQTALITLFVFLTVIISLATLPATEEAAWAAKKDDIDTLVNDKTGEVKLKTDGLEDVMRDYKALVKYVVGFSVITLVAVLAIHFVKLAQSSDNPERRKSALSGIFWTLVAAAGLGSIGFVIAFATKSFSDL
jgi:hypothetical protein